MPHPSLPTGHRPWPADPAHLHRAPSRAGRRLAAVAFLLALAAVAFAATVASLSGLAAPSPAAPTVTAVRHPQWWETSDVERCPPPGVGYEPAPTGPPPGEPAAPASPGGGR
jgi:hypothetical protein